MSQTIQQVIAIGGYDPVAYFSNEVLRGDPLFSASHDGLTYHFASEENKLIFERDPQRHAPLYGGYCATAAS